MVPTTAAKKTASTAPPSVTGLRITAPSFHCSLQKRQTGTVSEGDTRPRLLIVDDGREMVRLLEAITTATWEVHSAANLTEAVETATTHAVDVAVVDFMLPGGGGFSVARRLKELRPDCRVVMFSAAPVGHQAADSPDVDEFVMKGDLRVIRRLLDELAGGIQTGGA